jgi:hypothetical protein
LTYVGARRDGQHSALAKRKAKPKMVTTGQADTIGGELNLGVLKIKKERTTFKKAFISLPPDSDLLRERGFWSKFREVHELLGHPFLEAAEEIGKAIENYNRSLPRIYLDAMYLTDSRLANLTLSEIRTIRELSGIFPEVATLFDAFQSKVRVVHIFHLQESREGWVRDGSIRSYYFHGKKDEVNVIRIDKRDDAIESQYKEVLGKLGLSEEQPFRSQDSTVLYYLRERVYID